MDNNFKKYVLPSGLRIILVPQPQSLATTVLVLVEAGSKYETEEINGVSHFLEHMCFKGTEKRPTPLDIASEFDSLGAVYNAFTSHEVTGYFAKVSVDKIDTALNIISDLYQNPVFNEKEIEKEKGVIIEEINMYEDLPMRKVQDLFTDILYGNQPAGWPIAGTKEVVRSLKKKDIVNYRGAHYVAQATVVAVAGAFEEKEMLKKIKTLFANVPANEKFSKLPTKEFQKEPKTLVRYKESDQTHLVLGLRAFNRFDKRKYALGVLSDIMGGGMSSRLFQRVRENLGAAYYVRADNSLFTDHGFLSISAGIDHQKLKVVIEAILDEIKKVSLAPIKDEELNKTKNHLIGKIMIGLETSDELAAFYGEQEIFKEKVLKPQEIVEKIKSVTAKDILNVAKAIIDNKSLNLALIGPFKKLPSDINFKLS